MNNRSDMLYHRTMIRFGSIATRVRVVSDMVVSGMVASGVVVATILLSALPASAVNDDFAVWSANRCGVANFGDYGISVSRHGNNDDYIELWDECPDGLGVRARVWVGGNYLGSIYNGKGSGSDRKVFWDPFWTYAERDVLPGDWVLIEVCLEKTARSMDHVECAADDFVSVDG